MARTRARWPREHPIAAAALLGLAGAAAGLAAAQSAPGELQKSLYTASVALLFTGVLGGMIKLLLDDVAAVRRRQENAAEFVANVLRDLKGVYDRVSRVRIVVPAHRSVKTYGEEMRDVIEAGVQLRNVIRAVKQRPDLPAPLRARVVDEVCRMELYLERLTTEFRDCYKPLSDLQSAYEAAREPGAAPPADPWAALQGLPHLAELMHGGEAYATEFEVPLDAATRQLRNELAAILGFSYSPSQDHRPAASPSTGDSVRAR
jgi:hypothetical protein